MKKSFVILIFLFSLTINAQPIGGISLPESPFDPAWFFKSYISNRFKLRDENGFDVKTVDVDLNLDLANSEIVSNVTVKFLCTDNATTSVFFYLFDPSMVKHVKFEGNDVDFSVDPQGVISVSNLEMEEGKIYQLEVLISGKVECDSGQTFWDVCDFDGEVKHYFLYGSAVPYFFTSTSVDEYGGNLEVTIPSDYKGLVCESSGIFKKVSEENGSITYVFEHPYEVSYYYIFLGDYKVFESSYNDIPVKIYLTHDHALYGEELKSLINEILKFHSNMYTKYKFPKFDLVDGGNIKAGGYGTRASVILHSDVFNYFDYYMASTLAHEIGHQWWGSYIDFQGAGAVAVTEGLAEFSACYFMEKTGRDKNCFNKHIKGYLYGMPASDDMALASAGLDYNGGDSALTLIYQKAPSVLNMFLKILGKEKFFQALQTIVESKNSSSFFQLSDFFDAFSSVDSEETVNALLKPWFYTKGYLYLDTYFDLGEEGLKLKVYQINEPFCSFRLPFTYDFNGEPETIFIDFEKGDPQEKVIKEITELPAYFEINRDFNFIIRQKPSKIGDSNKDGFVDGFDLLYLAKYFNKGVSDFAQNPFYNEIVDFNQDKVIDDTDLSILLDNFGQSKQMNNKIRNLR